MGKAEERGWFHCAGLCEENLIWFEGMPVVIGDKSMAAGFFWCNMYNEHGYNAELISKMHKDFIDKVPLKV